MWERKRPRGANTGTQIEQKCNNKGGQNTPGEETG